MAPLFPAALARLTLIAVALTACNESSGAEPGAMLGAPVANLDDASLARFLLGKAVFERIATQEEGLGPLYNEVRCSGCHDVPVVGGAGFDVRVLKATRYADGRCDLLEREGGDNIQQRATAMLVERGITRENVPASATGRSLMTAPPLFGLGLVEAVSAQTIAERADPDDRAGDGISGRVATAADGTVGRFGRKGDLATIGGFVDTALRFELGLTTPGHPREEGINGGALPDGADPIGEPEIEQHGVNVLSEFVRYLAPPLSAPLSVAARDSVQQGERFFSDAGCSTCHVPEMRTAREAPGPLANVAVRMYSDLLLHDLGPALADVCGSSASPAEWLTARLWGLRFRTRFMHDGRATDMTQAILSHGGEATAARAAFSALDDRQRALLLRFLAAI
jgi:CxxC motif-containing protein (DUF1111 family)